ncbi:hypothetical protein GQR58_018201 [Nymphon striatum]|nr:hypothetical protein GQR58_018201 [Nymphon striatum]
MRLTLRRWNFKKVNWEEFKKKVEKQLQERPFQYSINENMRSFNKAIEKAAKSKIPRGVSKKYLPSWYDKLKDLIAGRRDARNLAETSANLQDHTEYNRLSAKVTDEYLKYTDSIPTSLPAWQRPNVAGLIAFGKDRLYWKFEKLFEKLTPALIGWDIFCKRNEIETDHFLNLKRIIKKRKLQGINQYEIRWEIIDPAITLPSEDHEIITTESVSDMQQFYPEICEQFENHSIPSQSGKSAAHQKIGNKRKIHESKANTITSHFKQKKPSSSEIVESPVADLNYDTQISF